MEQIPSDILINCDKPTSADQKMHSIFGKPIKHEVKEEMVKSEMVKEQMVKEQMVRKEVVKEEMVKEESKTSIDKKDYFNWAEEIEIKPQAEGEVFLDQGQGQGRMEQIPGDILINCDDQADKEMHSIFGNSIKHGVKEEIVKAEMVKEEMVKEEMVKKEIVKEESKTSIDEKDNCNWAEEIEMKFQAEEEVFLDQEQGKFYKISNYAKDNGYQITQEIDVGNNQLEPSYAFLKNEGAKKTLPQLDRKLSTYTGEKKYQCNLCEKAFRQKCGLSQHRAFHSSERPYVCVVCQKTFKYVSSLYNHRKLHIGFKPYRCNLCNKAFFQKGGLTHHAFTHNNKRPYKCDVCEEGFNQKSNLNCHKLKAHQRVDKPKYVLTTVTLGNPQEAPQRHQEPYNEAITTKDVIQNKAEPLEKSAQKTDSNTSKVLKLKELEISSKNTQLESVPKTSDKPQITADILKLIPLEEITINDEEQKCHEPNSNNDKEKNLFDEIKTQFSLFSNMSSSIPDRPSLKRSTGTLPALPKKLEAEREIANNFAPLLNILTFPKVPTSVLEAVSYSLHMVSLSHEDWPLDFDLQKVVYEVWVILVNYYKRNDLVLNQLWVWDQLTNVVKTMPTSVTRTPWINKFRCMVISSKKHMILRTLDALNESMLVTTKSQANFPHPESIEQLPTLNTKMSPQVFKSSSPNDQEVLMKLQQLSGGNVNQPTLTNQQMLQENIKQFNSLNQQPGQVITQRPQNQLIEQQVVPNSVQMQQISQYQFELGDVKGNSSNACNNNESLKEPETEAVVKEKFMIIKIDDFVEGEMFFHFDYHQGR